MKSKWYDMRSIDTLPKLCVAEFATAIYLVFFLAFQPRIISLCRQRDQDTDKLFKLWRAGVFNYGEVDTCLKRIHDRYRPLFAAEGW